MRALLYLLYLLYLLCLLCFACRACFGQRQLGPTMHLYGDCNGHVIAMAMLLVMMITIVVMLLLMVIVFQFASLALLWRCSLCCVCFGQCQLGPTMLLHIITVSAMVIYFSSCLLLIAT